MNLRRKTKTRHISQAHDEIHSFHLLVGWLVGLGCGAVSGFGEDGRERSQSREQSDASFGSRNSIRLFVCTHNGHQDNLDLAEDSRGDVYGSIPGEENRLVLRCCCCSIFCTHEPEPIICCLLTPGQTTTDDQGGNKRHFWCWWWDRN